MVPSKMFDKSQAINDFYMNYANVVRPIFEEQESVRKKHLALLIFSTIFFIGLVITFCVVDYLSSLVVIPAILLIIVVIGIVRNFRLKIKEKCMPLLLQAFGNIRWSSEASVISDTKLRSSELFSTYNKRTNDDTFVGVYKGVKYYVSETNMWYESGSGKRKTVWPVFNGVVISFASNKVVKNKTIVTTKGDVNVRNSHPILWVSAIILLVQILPSFFTGNKMSFDFLLSIWPVFLIIVLYLVIGLFVRKEGEVLNEIKLEDPEFNKKYQVFSSDEIEGRYLITPSFMERFRTLHTSFGTSKAKCSFYDDNIMFAISTKKNLFEIGDLFTPLTNPKQVNVFLSEISAIFDLIDYFKLDEKTGL